MKHGIVTCDVCGAIGAKTCYFRVDRKMDGAGSMDDVDEPMDLCRDHQWAAYEIAEKQGGFPVAEHVFEELRQRAVRMTTKRNAALAELPL